MERKPFPVIKLSLFFEQTKTGPYRMTKQFGGRSKKYLAMVDSIYEQWDADRKRLSVAADTTKVTEARS